MKNNIFSADMLDIRPRQADNPQQSEIAQGQPVVVCGECPPKPYRTVSLVVDRRQYNMLRELCQRHSITIKDAAEAAFGLLIRKFEKATGESYTGHIQSGAYDVRRLGASRRDVKEVLRSSRKPSVKF